MKCAECVHFVLFLYDIMSVENTHQGGIIALRTVNNLAESEGNAHNSRLDDGGLLVTYLCTKSQFPQSYD